jgi:hypothetical protein
MILICIAIAAAALGSLAALSACGVRRIEQGHPPLGRFVEVAGGYSPG